MGCEQFREAISARLDGEDEPVEPALTDAHLGGCRACRDWAAAAGAVTRLARVRPVPAAPGITEDELVAAFTPARPPAPPRNRRLVTTLRVALGAFGVAQFLLGMAQIAGVSVTDHAHGAEVAGATPGHLWHESAAWNVAVGAGFAWIALRRVRPAGALPMLTAFVALLALLSANDVLAGRVDWARLLSHGFVLAGYAIVVALHRPGLDPGAPSGDRTGPPWRWRAELDLDDEPAAPAARLRLINGTAHVPHQQPRRAA